jgi:hypothetical protein
MRILLFLLILPFLAAVGHDLYINYYLDEDKLRDLQNLRPSLKDFLISDLGWVWNKYAPTGMEIFKDTVQPGTWENIFLPILQKPTMLITAIPFAALFVLNMIIKIFKGEKIINFEARGAKKHKVEPNVYKHAKSKNMKFTRKN